MTIEIRRPDDGNILEVEASGKLTKDDYRKFAPEIERQIESQGKLRVLLVMRDFHGWDAGGLWEDVKFDAKHFSDIEKLAMVGDAKWEEWMAKFCRPFTTAEIKYFDLDEREEAARWMRAS